MNWENVSYYALVSLYFFIVFLLGLVACVIAELISIKIKNYYDEDHYWIGIRGLLIPIFIQCIAGFLFFIYLGLVFNLRKLFPPGFDGTHHSLFLTLCASVGFYRMFISLLLKGR
jgi:hypothetical protein